jgi:hypothetical protein
MDGMDEHLGRRRALDTAVPTGNNEHRIGNPAMPGRAPRLPGWLLAGGRGCGRSDLPGPGQLLAEPTAAQRPAAQRATKHAQDLTPVHKALKA